MTEKPKDKDDDVMALLKRLEDQKQTIMDLTTKTEQQADFIETLLEYMKIMAMLWLRVDFQIK